VEGDRQDHAPSVRDGTKGMLDRLKIKCPGSWMVLCEDKLDDGAPYSSESLTFPFESGNDPPACLSSSPSFPLRERPRGINERRFALCNIRFAALSCRQAHKVLDTTDVGC